MFWLFKAVLYKWVMYLHIYLLYMSFLNYKANDTDTHMYIYIYILVFQSAINMHHSTTWRSEAPSRISACCARRRLFGSEHFALHRLHLNSIWFICRFSWFRKGEVFKRPENIVLSWGIAEMFFLLMALPALGTLTRKITLFIDYPCQFVIWIWHRHTCIQF